MQKVKSCVLTKSQTGSGDGSPLFDAITGETVALSSTQGIDLDAVLRYSRSVGNPVLCKLTFQQHGVRLKNLAFYLLKRKDAYYPLSCNTGASRADSWMILKAASASVAKWYEEISDQDD